MKLELNLALCQMTSIDDPSANLKQILKLIDSVSSDQLVDLFCFPENCLYMRLTEGEPISGLSLTDSVFAELVSKAKARKCCLHLGASPIRIDGNLFNASVLIRSTGEISVTYKKMHLFDIQLVGQKAMKESDVFAHGPQPEILQLEGWKIGQSICYDLRFAELYSHYARSECDLILVPSSFLPKTGEAHWEILLRARAIESQAYVAASAQGGHHQGKGSGFRDTYGHSMLIDPWGKIISVLKQQPSVEVHRLTKNRITEVRGQIPMKAHRRLKS